ncbi:hypothetical protein QJS66_07650 [Kocuria rhizophila]|nr:hypothetical protein QJS66_07650 [Kocuria rhizophila]
MGAPPLRWWSRTTVPRTARRRRRGAGGAFPCGLRVVASQPPGCEPRAQPPLPRARAEARPDLRRGRPRAAELGPRDGPGAASSRGRLGRRARGGRRGAGPESGCTRCSVRGLPLLCGPGNAAGPCGRRWVDCGSPSGGPRGRGLLQAAHGARPPPAPVHSTAILRPRPDARTPGRRSATPGRMLWTRLASRGAAPVSFTGSVRGAVQVTAVALHGWGAGTAVPVRTGSAGRGGRWPVTCATGCLGRPPHPGLWPSTR